MACRLFSSLSFYLFFFPSTFPRSLFRLFFKKTKQVRLLVDAEYTAVQPAIDAAALELMREFNSSDSSTFAVPPTVYNTTQCYLRGAPEKLLGEIELAAKGNFAWGGKLVRGAYIDSENKRAAAANQVSPCWPSLEQTHACFDACARIAIEEGVFAAQKGEALLATHNKASVGKAVDLLSRLEKEHGHPAGGAASSRVSFGQLYGMRQVLTFFCWPFLALTFQLSPRVFSSSSLLSEKKKTKKKNSESLTLAIARAGRRAYVYLPYVFCFFVFLSLVFFAPFRVSPPLTLSPFLLPPSRAHKPAMAPSATCSRTFCAGPSRTVKCFPAAGERKKREKKERKKSRASSTPFAGSSRQGSWRSSSLGTGERDFSLPFLSPSFFVCASLKEGCWDEKLTVAVVEQKETIRKGGGRGIVLFQFSFL